MHVPVALSELALSYCEGVGQQASERKKAYLNDLEVRAKDLEKKNSELEERVSTVQNENQMLRHMLKNTIAGRRGSGGGGGGSGLDGPH
ncbi:hypothetical protein MLD38_006136 [Melastoma candidum]|uniref:Uncharacterized protein n=1 Tax=Melastoma candidum TaxID=119954 RepID=A0ACB9RVD7_9MYRT|nr:hypothetical protein MLD38_006136 [Melastoma candidum]